MRYNVIYEGALRSTQGFIDFAKECGAAGAEVTKEVSTRLDALSKTNAVPLSHERDTASFWQIVIYFLYLSTNAAWLGLAPCTSKRWRSVPSRA